MRRGSLRAPRYRGKHCHLIGIGDEIAALGGFAIAPYPARRQHLGEGAAVAISGIVEDFADGGATECLSAGARSLSSCGEESERGHPQRLGVDGTGSTDAPGAVPSTA